MKPGYYWVKWAKGTGELYDGHWTIAQSHTIGDHLKWDCLGTEEQFDDDDFSEFIEIQPPMEVK